MVTSKTASLLARILACSLALVALVGRDSSAKAPMARQASLIIPVPNLVGYWSMDSATGTLVEDGTLNMNDGALSGTAAISTAQFSTVPADNPASLSLPANANSLLTVPDSASLSVTGQLTVAAWIRPTTPAGGTQKGIIEKWDGPSAHAGYWFRLNSSNNLSFAVCQAAGYQDISTVPRAIPLNTWSHVAATYGAGNAMTLYVNGDDDDTTGVAAGPPTDGVSSLLIGASYSAHPFGGHIDEARVYNRALTMAEIQILRDGQTAPTMQIPAAIAGYNQISWTPPAGAPAGITYSLLHGPSTNNYTGVITGITQTTYDHAATQGVPTYYRVVAVTVMASPPSTLEVSSTPGPTGPPPPPPPPRTSKLGNEDNPCGCGTVSPMSGGLAALGLLIVLLALIPGRLLRG
ncbi:MAG: LamG domain-containing protein [Planctomycetota bacterium]|nr:MAG: LamG domain-containing protein [Planctomycetota bacterium]